MLGIGLVADSKKLVPIECFIVNYKQQKARDGIKIESDLSGWHFYIFTLSVLCVVLKC